MAREIGSHWAVLEIAEQAAPGNTIDLWPRIEAQAAVRTRNTARSNPCEKRAQLAIGLGLLLLLVGSLAFVPAVRAFAEDIIQRMGIAFVDTDRFDPNTQMGKLEATVVSPLPSLSIAEIRAQIKFSLRLPAWLPEGLNYIYRSMPELKNGQHVDIQYCRSTDLDIRKGCLQLHASYGTGGAPPLLAESKEQTVEINGQPAIYVHGGWQDDGRGDPNTRLGNLLWDDQADDAYLTWVQDGVTYLLEAHDLSLNLEEMQRVAASMTEEERNR